MQFRVVGASRETGEDIERVVEATSWLAAEAAVAHEILVERVDPLTQTPDVDDDLAAVATAANSVTRTGIRATAKDPWPTESAIAFWITVVGMGFVALAVPMRWVEIFSGGISGIASIIGKVGLAITGAVLAVILISRNSGRQFTFSAALASAWASFVATFSLVLAYRILNLPSNDNGPFGIAIAAQIGVGNGIYAAVSGSIATIVAVGYVYRRAALQRPRSWTPMVISYAVGIAGAIACINIPATIGLTPSGLSDPDPSVSAKKSAGFTVDDREYSINGTPLQWRAWEISNEQNSPLTIVHVYLNGEYDAPLAAEQALVKQFYKDPDSSPPVTISIGDSRLFFECNPNDKQSYYKRVVFLDVETNRGDFRYTPPGQLRGLTSEEKVSHAENARGYEAQHEKDLATMRTPAEIENEISRSFGGIGPDGKPVAPPADMVEAGKKQMEARQRPENSP